MCARIVYRYIHTIWVEYTWCTPDFVCFLLSRHQRLTFPAGDDWQSRNDDEIRLARFAKRTWCMPCSFLVSPNNLLIYFFLLLLSRSLWCFSICFVKLWMCARAPVDVRALTSLPSIFLVDFFSFAYFVYVCREWVCVRHLWRITCKFNMSSTI